MKLNWGHGVVLVMVGFIAIMTQFMYRAYHNQESLVAEDYYAKELRYQEQIDKRANASALGAVVSVEVLPGRIVFVFPEQLRDAEIEAEAYFMRPSDPRGDQRMRLTVGEDGRAEVDTGDLLRGAYHLRLEWSAAGTEYLLEDRIHLP